MNNNTMKISLSITMTSNKKYPDQYNEKTHVLYKSESYIKYIELTIVLTKIFSD